MRCMRTSCLVVALLVALCSVDAHKHQRRHFHGAQSAIPQAELETVGAAFKDDIQNGMLREGAMLPQMSVYPEDFGDLTDVTISWSGVVGANASDYIISSCGPLNALGLSDYLDRVPAYANTSDPGIAAGSGSVMLLLMYMRCEYVLTYINVQGNANVAVSAIRVRPRESPCAPKQGHLSIADGDDEMMITYVSGCLSNPPMVKYGFAPDDYHEMRVGSSVTYNASQMCAEPSTIVSQQWYRDPGFIHRVVMTDLRPDTRYFYQFGNDADGWSREYTFKSKASPWREDVSFLVYADMGFDPEPSATGVATWALQDALNGYDDFLLHVGDISYARGTGWNWEYFFHMIEPVATRVPYMASIGNHEYDHLAGGQNDPSKAAGEGFHPLWGNMGDDSSGECSVPMYYRFSAPSNGNGIYWYSFDYGPVHVIQFSSEHNWTRGSQQYNWIQQDLASLNRTQTPFVVLTAHRMMYTTQLQEDADYIVSQHMQAEMDDLINQYHVNVMFVGHQHSYERSCPVYKRECVLSGAAPVHIIIGTAGAGLEHGGFSSKLGGWSVSHVEAWGYGRVRATRDRMHIEFVLSTTGEVYDEVTLLPY